MKDFMTIPQKECRYFLTRVVKQFCSADTYEHGL